MNSTPRSFATDSIEERFRKIQGSIEDSLSRSNRNGEHVRIVAVTKTLDVDSARKARALGIRDIGENKVQEALKKYELKASDPKLDGVTFHLIGHLQSNKARSAVQIFDSIDTVDSLKLATVLSHISGELGKSLKILLQVNTSGETSKSGFSVPDFQSVAKEILDLPNLVVAGLMTIGPRSENPIEIRRSFRKLRELFITIRETYAPRFWETLSMGMSNDFDVAIEEGATEIRIGSALFGERRQA